MKKDVASTFPPLAAQIPADKAPTMPLAAQPVLPTIPIIPIVAARPTLADELVRTAPAQNLDLARDLTLFARVLRRAEGGRWVMAIFVASTAITIANMFGQVELNHWNGRFFDAVARKDLTGFVHDIYTFLGIITVLLAITVAQTFLQERLKFRVREWIARHLLVEWLKPMRIYQLSFAGQYGHNPDQRIQEDTRLLGDYSADLGCGIVYSLLQIVAFVGVLWTLSAQVTFQVGRYDIAIPGYMVWCALAYALIGSGLTWLVGRPLIALNGDRYAREAEFRFALVRANGHRATWGGRGRTTTSRGRARGCREYHAANILFARPPHLDHIGHRLAVDHRSNTCGCAGLFRRRLDPRGPYHGGRRLQPGAGGDEMVRR
jgi:putative ATP-binding cassette transporter